MAPTRAASGFVLFMLAITLPLNAQWQQSAVLDASGVESMAVSDTAVFAGTGYCDDIDCWGSIHRSTDGGTTWENVRSGMGIVTSLLAHDGIIFAGTLWGNAGVLRSTNGGSSWVSSNTGLPARNVMCLGEHAGVLYAGLQFNGLHRSTDHGTTWSPCGLSANTVLACVVTDSLLFAGTFDAGVFASSDAGTTWVERNNGITTTMIDDLVGDGSLLYCGTGGHGVFRSTDAGVTWSAASLGLGGTWVKDLTLEADMLLAATNAAGGVSVSFDQAGHWTPMNRGWGPPDVFSMAVTEGTLFAGTLGEGIWRRPLAEFVSASVPVALRERWNFLSIPVRMEDQRPEVVFPDAGSLAYRFFELTGYVGADSLLAGVGYWVRFDSAHVDTLVGRPVAEETTHVQRGWNMLGSITHPVPVAGVVEIPPGVVVSPYYGFADSLFVADTIEPGRAYWVKVSQDARLVLGAPARSGTSDARGARAGRRWR